MGRHTETQTDTQTHRHLTGGPWSRGQELTAALTLGDAGHALPTEVLGDTPVRRSVVGRPLQEESAGTGLSLLSALGMCPRTRHSSQGPGKGHSSPREKQGAEGSW